MYTLDKRLVKHIIGNLIATVFFALFGAVYEIFSHEVYSYYMIYSFAFPLCMGAAVYLIMALKGVKANGVFLNLWNSAIAAFTVGSFFKGVLDIFGTTNKLIIVYPIAGAVLATGAVAGLLAGKKPQQ